MTIAETLAEDPAQQAIPEQKARSWGQDAQELALHQQIDSEWDEAVNELAEAWEKPKKRNPKRFGMSSDLREALTRFARIGRSVEKAKQFQTEWPNFFPAVFWGSKVQTPEVTGSKPMTLWRAWGRLLENAWKAGFHSEYVIQLNSVPLADPVIVKPKPNQPSERYVEIQPVHDFQRAVAAMGESPWRAKFCSRCGLAFAAEKPQDRHCSDKCRKEAKRRTFKGRWEKYGKPWRKRQQRAKRKRAAA